jgi:hypothetical protein
MREYFQDLRNFYYIFQAGLPKQQGLLTEGLNLDCLNSLA